MKKKEKFYFVIEMDLKDKTIKSSLDDSGLVVRKEIKMLPLSSLIEIIDKRIDKKLKEEK